MDNGRRHWTPGTQSSRLFNDKWPGWGGHGLIIPAIVSKNVQGVLGSELWFYIFYINFNKHDKFSFFIIPENISIS